MSATKLYAELSRKVMLLNNKSILGEFIQNDMTLVKLRALLLCRSCREICLEPFGSDLCQHLTCEECVKERNVRQGCKWCRNPEDLSLDFQSKILIASYRKLCAILRDFVAGYANKSSGITKEGKDKLLQTLDEGCGYPRNESNAAKEAPDYAPDLEKKEKQSKGIQAELKEENRHESPVCPPCCCTCPKVKGEVKSEEKSPKLKKKEEVITNILSDIKDEEKFDYGLDYIVSSTVPDQPDIIPATNSTPDGAPDEKAQNKYGASENKDGGEKSAEINESHVDDNAIKGEPEVAVADDKPEISVVSCEAITSITNTDRENKGIFEKFGLPLSPATPTQTIVNNSPRSKSAEKIRRKLKKSKEKKMTYTCEIKQKLQPLKLKVRKVNSYNSNDGYSVQYNISKTNAKEKKEVDTFTIHKSEDCKVSDDYVTSDNLTGSDSQETESRKEKRKATSESKYAGFSDDSDFESDSYLSKGNPKVALKKDKAEACSCGSGSTVKYFTNICKRQRCPCFSQGKPCATCKCRFCSNPYLGKDETDDMFTDSDSENEQPQLTYWLKDENEVVDVESM